MKKIFISYCHENISFVEEEFCKKVNEDSLEILRDIKSISLGARFDEFMERINEADHVVAVISDSYMKSENCMYELLLLSESESQNKLIPIFLEKTMLSLNDNVLFYEEYWNNELARKKECVEKLIHKSNKNEYAQCIPIIQKIAENIVILIKKIAEIKGIIPVTFEYLYNSNCKEIIYSDYLKFFDTIGIDPIRLKKEISKKKESVLEALRSTGIADTKTIAAKQTRKNIFIAFELLNWLKEDGIIECSLKHTTINSKNIGNINWNSQEMKGKKQKSIFKHNI